MGNSRDKGDGEDDFLWSYVTRDIEPFHDKKEEDQKNSNRKKPEIKTKSAAFVQEAPSSASGRDVDGRTARRLQQGKMPIEARIDLHGMTQGEAKGTLEAFITRSYEQGKRLVLVITGKGNLRGREDKSGEDWTQEKPGVLKRRVPDWLDDNPLRNIVLQYHCARPQHGGDGALYVLLRRKR